jgi:hypothetical protein
MSCSNLENKGERRMTKREEDKIKFPDGHYILLGSWISLPIRKILHDAVNNGISRKEFQRVYGNARLCYVAIEQSEYKQELLELYPEASWFQYPKIRVQDILEKERTLRGLAPTLVDKEVPIDEFETDNQKVDVIIDPNIMPRILKYFRDKKGNYKGYRVIVEGEVAESKETKRNSPLLEKYKFKNLTKKPKKG